MIPVCWDVCGCKLVVVLILMFLPVLFVERPMMRACEALGFFHAWVFGSHKQHGVSCKNKNQKVFVHHA